MIKPSIEQRQACDELIKDIVNQIWIGVNIYKRTEFKVYPNLTKYLTYCVMKDIDKGVWDNKEITTKNIMELYCK